MATISITSNDGALNSASSVLEVTATNPEYNQPALRIKQAGEEARPRSGSMTRILISSLSKLVCRVLIPTPGSSRLPFRQTNSRSMAAKPMLAPTKASKPLSYLRGRQRVAISVSDSRKPTTKSLEEERVSSRLLMLPPPRRRISLALGFCMSRTGRSSIEARTAR
jgi:hypothetical protein